MTGRATVGNGASPAEKERLDALRRYQILDSPPDGAFDRITALAARLFSVPIAIVSLVDTDRIWFKSHHGLDVEEIERAPGLCASAILQHEPWLVTNARIDPRTLANPLVVSDFGLQFYAGVPLKTSDGHNLGTLCVIDVEPRDVSDEEVAVLSDLAAVVMDEMELRLSARRTVELEAKLRRGAEEIAVALQDSLLPPHLPYIDGLEIEARYNVANRDQVGGDFYDVIAEPGGCAVIVGDACGKGTRAASLTATARWVLHATTVGDWTPADSLRRLNHVLLRAHDDPEHYCTVAMGSLRRGADGGAKLTVSLGGHPAPLVLRTDGTIESIGMTSAAVGWLNDTVFTDTVVDLGPGDLVVLFTDGLLETLGGHGSADIGAIGGMLRHLAGQTAAQVADYIDTALGGTTLNDDAAFLVLRCL